MITDALCEQIFIEISIMTIYLTMCLTQADN